MATWLFPFDSDHWVFAYIGRIWSGGGTLYVDAWDHKSPLIFAYNGLIYKLFGDDIIWSRIVFTVVAILSAWVFYKTVRLLLSQLDISDTGKIAKITTLVFIVLSNVSEFTNSGNNNENIAILFLLGTTYFYLLYRRGGQFSSLLMSGLLAGFVFNFKVNFALLLLPIIIDIIYQKWPSFKKIITNLLLFGLGIIIQLAFWLNYFYQAGILNEYIKAGYTFNASYIRAMGWDFGAPGIEIFLGILALLMILFLPFAISSINDTIKIPKNRKKQAFVSLMTLSVLLFVATAGTFYSYYFLIIVPFVCLVMASTFSSVYSRLSNKMIYSLMIVLFIFIAISYRQLYNTYYGPVAKDATAMSEVAEYVKNNSRPEEKVFANMYGAVFYKLSGRDSGSRFISASYLLIDHKYNLGFKLDQIALSDFEQSKPKYFIVGNDVNDLYLSENKPITNYILNNYRLEKEMSGYDVYARN